MFTRTTPVAEESGKRSRRSLADRRAATQGVNLGQLHAQAIIDTAQSCSSAEGRLAHFLLQLYGFTVAWPVWWGGSALRREVGGLLSVLD